ncbi:ATP-binding cassette domain-containing protein [Rhodocytophaga aerolata]|uniref:ATP-binding cassette domain-containing protein n=1 Tax=Rhodocytophaga aerolata TaxID=455078 RepID=A0ABT8R740_9BACT|nr:ATP-binding cassette domain-containing protein [Rhodocytophaga aerolata]MDO1447917.1 ATP-binding cassette domain-containing protein [Rhodocytophaga aerolata]
MSRTHTETIVELTEASFYHRQHLLFDQLTWQIRKNEQWAIIGPTGSGKTSLINALTGKFILRHGQLSYPFLEQYRPTPDSYLPVNDFIRVVSFGEDSALLNYANFYYQQRFNAAQSEGIITAQEFLEKGLSEDPVASEINQVCRLLGIEEVLPLEFIKLSNGQTRKLRIAKALLAKPLVLILDNPFIGLDTATRADLNQIINHLIETGTQVILTTSSEEFPQKITHILALDNFQINRVYTKEEYLKQQFNEYPLPDGEKILPTLSLLSQPEPDFTIAFQFTDVSVKYGDKPALQHINWTVKKGEKWALLGPNGSGKSTILSLINADHPQAYANTIVLFDKIRGTGESIWDIKKRIGFVSPELHLYFKQQIPCWEVVATGYFDTLYLNQKVTDSQKDSIQKHFVFFHLADLMEQSFQSISSGQQRIVLLIRSLIKQPEVIIWDEPYQALDAYYINLSAKLLQMYCTPATTLIFVSHYSHEIPTFVNNYLVLDRGRISKLAYTAQ